VKFTESPLSGAYTVETEPIEDTRGFFARVWCADEFRALSLNTIIEQGSISFNRKKGTLRGMHYQTTPKEEVKLVRCTRGAIYDVILDLRTGSPTFGRWFATELTAENGKMMYVPIGFAHGFQTLVDQSEVFYQISEKYHPGMARGVRWNDPRFQIEWPLRDPILSVRDRDFPDFSLTLDRLAASR
jgi:dTDP-4-dehydrorhamnose 3,5-epimerase